jgi:tripartite-type tricarboxylate transporter receptor subunit TctC
MKRKLVFLLISLMLISILSGCSQTSSAPPSGAPADGASDETDVDWPTKPVNFVLGFAAGGGADLTARAVFHPYVEDILGQKFIISYKPGASGAISYTELAKNKSKDGYDIAWCAQFGFLSMPLTDPNIQFELEDFQPVANISTDPNIFIARKDSQFDTLVDVVDYAKENPGELSIADNVPNSDDNVAVEMFKNAAGIELNQIVYSDGTVDRVTATMGGHTDLAVLNASEVTAYIGEVKILGVSSRDRLDFIPDVPTFVEQGYEVINASDRGVIMTAGVPEPVVKKLSDAIGQAMSDPKCQEKLRNLNLIPLYMDYEEYTEYLYNTREEYKEIMTGNS